VQQNSGDGGKETTMNITLNLTPKLEMKLRESAARGDAEAVRCLLADAFAPTVEALLQQSAAELSDAEFEAIADQLADELAACRESKAQPLSDYAVSREGIYEDHP
jgi:antitoxin ParD1/3/4